ncbi:MAG: DUF1592 domain-containing protein [Myxococcales bacterium]|nr:DUF1592 domain-containing protein [Myxococcales bacterium]
MREHPWALFFGIILAGCQGIITPGATHITQEEEVIIHPPTPAPGEPIIPVTAVPQPLRRLTHQQWLGAVHYTLQLPDIPDFDLRNFPSDQEDNFLFGNDPQALGVSPALFDTYRSRASAIADYIVSSAAHISSIINSNTITEATVQAAITTLGRRAYRRPLRDAEVTSFMNLYGTGMNNPGEDLSPEQSGLLLVVRALFESPYFLYLAIPEGDTEGPTKLDAHTLATRLSYFLWNEPPDATLRNAADTDQLRESAELDTQTSRMMADPRFQSVIYNFHNTALGGLGAFSTQAPDLYESAKNERLYFISDAVENDLSWKDILTSPHTFVNSTLAEIYGITGDFSENNFKKVLLPATERKGTLTHISFLGGVPHRPVPRGVWLSRMIGCNFIGSAVNADPVPASEPGESRRDIWEAYTEVEGSTCIACHRTKINSFGFAFESYDERGQHRTNYGPDFSDSPVNTIVQNILLDGQLHSAANAMELADQLAEAKSTHECYAKHLAEFALGRPETSLDEGLIQNLRLLSAEGRPIRELIRYIIQSNSFRIHQLDPEHKDI